MSNFFENKKIIEEWNREGEEYAKGINEMVEFAEKNGWENWKGKEPEDKRGRLAEDVITLLKQANLEGKTDEFRTYFPPAHSPLLDLLENKSQSIEQLHFIKDQKIVFLIGSAYKKQQAYLLDGDHLTILNPEIRAIGKSKQNNIFAVVTENIISIQKDWDGELIKKITLKETAEYGITEIIPFNDGSKVLLVTSGGIYLISEGNELLIHPEKDGDDDDEFSTNIAMENATISNDNKYIIAGDQDFDHRVLDIEGNQIGNIGPQSSYPHFCLFAKDDSQVITNSCHFYNGITIGVDTTNLDSINIEPYQESEDYIIINDQMRVYAGLATSKYYILGDAYGYIRAIDKKGNQVWQYFLGSTISGMTISDDEQILWVGSYSGMLHKLYLDKGWRDTHTIGTGKHYEEFRLLFWKDEPQVWKW